MPNITPTPAQTVAAMPPAKLTAVAMWCQANQDTNPARMAGALAKTHRLHPRVAARLVVAHNLYLF